MIKKKTEKTVSETRANLDGEKDEQIFTPELVNRKKMERKKKEAAAAEAAAQEQKKILEKLPIIIKEFEKKKYDNIKNNITTIATMDLDSLFINNILRIIYEKAPVLKKLEMRAVVSDAVSRRLRAADLEATETTKKKAQLAEHSASAREVRALAAEKRKNQKGGNFCNGNIFDLKIDADALWDAIDGNEDGNISKEELTETLDDFGLDEETITALIADIEGDPHLGDDDEPLSIKPGDKSIAGDGLIQKDEFINWLNQSGLISKRLKQINSQNYDDFKNLQRLKFHMDRIHDFKGDHAFADEKTIKDTYSSFLEFHNNKVKQSDLKAFFDSTFTKYNSIEKKHEEHFYFSQIITFLQEKCNLINDLNIYKYSHEETIAGPAHDKFKVIFNADDEEEKEEYVISTMEDEPTDRKFEEDNVAFSFEDNSITQKVLYPLVHKQDPGKYEVSKEDLDNYQNRIRDRKINTISSFLDPAWTSASFNTLSLGIDHDIDKYRKLSPLEKQQYKILETQNFNHEYSYYAIDLFKDSIQNFFDYHDAKLKVDFNKKDSEHNELINECITYLNYLEDNDGTERPSQKIPNSSFENVNQNIYPIYFTNDVDGDTINIEVVNYKRNQSKKGTIKLKSGDTTIDSIFKYVNNPKFKYDDDPIGWNDPPTDENKKHSRLYKFGKIIFDSIVKTDLLSSFEEIPFPTNPSEPPPPTGAEAKKNRFLAYIVITFKALGDSMQINYNKRLNNFIQKNLSSLKNKIAIKTTDKNVIAECFLVDQPVWSTNSGLTSHINWINDFKLGPDNQLNPDETSNYKLLITNYPMNNTVLYYNNICKTIKKIKTYMGLYNKGKFTINYDGRDIEDIPDLDKDAIVSDDDIQKINNNELIQYLRDLNKQKSGNGIFSPNGYSDFVSILRKYGVQTGGYRQTMFPEAAKINGQADYIVNFFKTTVGTSTNKWVDWSETNLGLTFPNDSPKIVLKVQFAEKWYEAIKQYETKNKGAVASAAAAAVAADAANAGPAVAGKHPSLRAALRSVTLAKRMYSAAKDRQKEFDDAYKAAHALAGDSEEQEEEEEAEAEMAAMTKNKSFKGAVKASIALARFAMAAENIKKIPKLDDSEWVKSVEEIPFESYDGDYEDKNKNYLFELNRSLSKIINIYESLYHNASSFNNLIDSYSKNLIDYVAKIEDLFFKGNSKVGYVHEVHNNGLFVKVDIKKKKTDTSPAITNLSFKQIKIVDPNKEGKFKFYEDGDEIPKKEATIQFKERLSQSSLNTDIYNNFKKDIKLIMKDLKIYDIFNLLNGDIINLNNKINDKYNEEKAIFSNKMKQIIEELQGIIFPIALPTARARRNTKKIDYGKFRTEVEAINIAYDNTEFKDILDKIDTFITDNTDYEVKKIETHTKKDNFCGYLENFKKKINTLADNSAFQNGNFQDDENSLANAISINSIIQTCQQKPKQTDYALFWDKTKKTELKDIIKEITNFANSDLYPLKRNLEKFIEKKEEDLTVEQIGQKMPEHINDVAEFLQGKLISTGVINDTSLGGGNRKTKRKPKKKSKKLKKKSSTKKKPKKKSSTKKKPQKKPSKKKPKKKPSTKKKSK
jgi:hypothetical protein